MSALKGTQTHDNLKAAFAGESQANRRYLYFAKQADVEGYADVAGLFRDTAEGGRAAPCELGLLIGEGLEDVPVLISEPARELKELHLLDRGLGGEHGLEVEASAGAQRAGPLHREGLTREAGLGPEGRQGGEHQHEDRPGAE
jgi:hypothetical protein